jgi:hypothetical protein
MPPDRTAITRENPQAFPIVHSFEQAQANCANQPNIDWRKSRTIGPHCASAAADACAAAPVTAAAGTDSRQPAGPSVESGRNDPDEKTNQLEEIANVSMLPQF